MLTYLSGVTKGPVQKLEVLINVITVTFDMNQPTQVSLAELCRLPPLFVGMAEPAAQLPLPATLGWGVLLLTPSLLPVLVQNAMTVPNWNRCAQTMFDIMVSVSAWRQVHNDAELFSTCGLLPLPVMLPQSHKFDLHTTAGAAGREPPHHSDGQPTRGGAH